MTPRTQAAVVAVGIAALVWFSFGQARSCPFVNFDDPEYVYEVPEINHGLTFHGVAWAFTHLPSPNWYPLTNLSHMVEAQLFGMNAGAFHLTNILLHAATAILLFLVLRQMSGALWPSAFVAALFAIHPLRAESVMWITERKDVLSGFFFVLTLGAYVRYVRQRSLGRYVAMTIMFVCDLMSKPMVVTTPFVLLLLDYWPLGRSRKSEVRGQKSKVGGQKLLLEKVPLFGISIASALITSLGGAHFRVASEHLLFATRSGNAAISYLVYIWQMIWPAKLAVFYPLPAEPRPVWQILMAIFCLIVVTGIAFLFRRARPYLLVGWLWYVVMLFPVAGLVQVNLQAHADRYTYLPQIGLYVAITWALCNVSLGWHGRRQILAGAALIAVGLFAWTARIQAGTWRDSETLWRHALSVTTDNAFAHASLADLLLRRDATDEAIGHCREALRIHPADADAENNLGLALLQKGEINDAEAHFNRCLAINPDHMNGQANLAWILATAPDVSMRDGNRAIQLATNLLRRSGHSNAVVLRTLAAAYAEAGRFPEAIQTAENALDLVNATGNTGLAADLRANIDSYRMNQPLRSDR